MTEKTRYCIVAKCHQIATNWSGHLIKSRDKVIAGFCDAHKGTPCPNWMKNQGCYGLYDKTLQLIAYKEEPDVTGEWVPFGSAWREKKMQEPKEQLVEKYKRIKIRSINMEAVLIDILVFIQHEDMWPEKQQQIKRALEGGVNNG